MFKAYSSKYNIMQQFVFLYLLRFTVLNIVQMLKIKSNQADLSAYDLTVFEYIAAYTFDVYWHIKFIEKMDDWLLANVPICITFSVCSCRGKIYQHLEEISGLGVGFVYIHFGYQSWGSWQLILSVLQVEKWRLSSIGI